MEIQPIDITQIFVAIIAAGSAIYAAKKHSQTGSGPKPEGKGPKPPRPAAPKNPIWIIVMGISITLLVANLAVFGWRSCSHITVTDIKITYPYDGATVETREMVRGSSNIIPERDVLWVVVYSQFIGRYYPQNDPPDVQADGDWSSLAFIGVEEDVSRKFDIIVVLLNKTAQDIFNDYLSQAKGKETWPGLESLPKGAVIHDRVTVTRK